METYSMSCHRAALRLQRGLPATMEHADTGPRPGGPSSDPLQAVRDVADCTECLITLMDAVRIDQRAADELTAPAQNAVVALNRVQYLTPQLKTKRELMVGWLSKLQGMRAAQRLGDDEARQLLMDTEQTYSDFKQMLPG